MVNANFNIHVTTVVEQPAPKKSRVFTPEEQKIILNVYKFVKRSWPERRWSMSDCSEKTAAITGLTKPAVHRLLKERKPRRRPIGELVDPVALTAIRRKIYRFYHELGHGVPRPENILREVNADPDLPNYTLPAFRRVLHHLKYRHVIAHSRGAASSRCETFSIPVV